MTGQADGADPRPHVDADLWFRSIYGTPLLLAGIADLDGRVLDANQLSTDGVGYARELVVGRLFRDGPWWDDTVRDRIGRLCAEAAEHDKEVRAELPWVAGDGSWRHVDLAISPVHDPDGRATNLFLSGLDITARVTAEEQLATNLELVRSLLDSVGDGIYGIDLEGRAVFVNRSALATLGYRDHDLLGEVVHDVMHRGVDGSALSEEHCPAMRAIASGRTVSSGHETFRRADGGLVPVELIAAPTFTEGRTSGAVVSFRDISERLAARAQAERLEALAVSEAANRALADRLQQVLLSEPSQTGDLRVAARYRPASTSARVGGDWYDAFVQPDGAVILMIGDVMGHDIEAAAAMGQLRSLLRGIAYGSVEGPARLLERLDEAARSLGVGMPASAVLVRVEPLVAPSEGGDGTRRAAWANAGHPPPVLRRDGAPAELLATHAELLLCVGPTGPRTDHIVHLGPEDTLVLFTDGLVERRGSELDDGLAVLVEAVDELPGADPDELCDGILARLIGDVVDDDVAVLVARGAAGTTPAGTTPAGTTAAGTTPVG